MANDFETLKNEIIELMAEHPNMALATSTNNRTTCRMVSCVNDGLTVFFQTSTDSLKFEQLAANPNVALCFGNASLEGKAEILGHPSDEPAFMARYEARHPASFKRYSSLDEERVVRVSPRLITLWKYIEGKPCREILDPASMKAERVWIDTSRRINENGD
ncbi:MAG: pyridoxamine 5'-phosphate oxidase family protein [Spirochaetales bacterium]|nr:pyridoxamine 5'-phosphate oxidase family protein [Spirochaetales bacterium]